MVLGAWSVEAFANVLGHHRRPAFGRANTGTSGVTCMKSIGRLVKVCTGQPGHDWAGQNARGATTFRLIGPVALQSVWADTSTLKSNVFQAIKIESGW